MTVTATRIRTPRRARSDDGASCRRGTQHPVVGVVALDLMASIAGPALAPDHAASWNAAVEIVTRALVGRDESRHAPMQPSS
jgi:hypothetical protein